MRKTPQKTKPTNATHTANAGWSAPIYVYWFIILFFIAATFYILGRSHEFMHPRSNVTVTEESLIQPEDYVEKAMNNLEARGNDLAEIAGNYLTEEYRNTIVSDSLPSDAIV